MLNFSKFNWRLTPLHWASIYNKNHGFCYILRLTAEELNINQIRWNLPCFFLMSIRISEKKSPGNFYFKGPIAFFINNGIFKVKCKLMNKASWMIETFLYNFFLTNMVQEVQYITNFIQKKEFLNFSVLSIFFRCFGNWVVIINIDEIN